MWGLGEWAKSKSPVVKAYAASMAEVATAKWADFKVAFQDNFIVQHFHPIWDAASHALSRNTYRQITSSHRIKHLLWGATQSSVLYTGSVIAYECVEPTLLSYMPAPLMIRVPYVQKPLAQFIMSNSARALFFRFFVRRFIDAAVRGVTLSTVADMELLNAEHKQDFSCPCTITAAIDPATIFNWKFLLHIPRIRAYAEAQERIARAQISSTIYYMLDVIYLTLLGKSMELVLPKEVSSLPSALKAVLIGRGLLEFNMASMCTRHRNDLLNDNYYYSFGLGLALLSVVNSVVLLVDKATGVNNFFVYQALYSAVYHYFTMVAMTVQLPSLKSEARVEEIVDDRLEIDGFAVVPASNSHIPLNRQKPWEVFGLGHRLSRAGMERGWKWIVQQLKQDQASTKWSEFLQSSEGKLLRRLLIGSDFESMSAIFKRQAIADCLDVTGKGIQEGVRQTEIVRDHRLTQAIFAANQKVIQTKAAYNKHAPEALRVEEVGFLPNSIVCIYNVMQREGVKITTRQTYELIGVVLNELDDQSMHSRIIQRGTLAAALQELPEAPAPEVVKDDPDSNPFVDGVIASAADAAPPEQITLPAPPTPQSETTVALDREPAATIAALVAAAMSTPIAALTTPTVAASAPATVKATGDLFTMSLIGEYNGDDQPSVAQSPMTTYGCRRRHVANPADTSAANDRREVDDGLSRSWEII